MTRDRAFGAAILLSCLLCTFFGCTRPARPLQFELLFERGAPLPETAQVAAAASCPVGLIAVTDERSNQESIGDAGLPVIATGVVEWTREAIASLAAYGHPFTDLAQGGAGFAGLGLDVVINKVYCRSQPMSLRGVVVLTVKYLKGDTSLGQRVYRGEAVEDKGLLFGQANTGFSADTAQRVLNEAFRKAVAEIHADAIALSGTGAGE